MKNIKEKIVYLSLITLLLSFAFIFIKIDILSYKSYNFLGILLTFIGYIMVIYGIKKGQKEIYNMGLVLYFASFILVFFEIANKHSKFTQFKEYQDTRIIFCTGFYILITSLIIFIPSIFIKNKNEDKKEVKAKTKKQKKIKKETIKEEKNYIAGYYVYGIKNKQGLFDSLCAIKKEEDNIILYIKDIEKKIPISKIINIDIKNDIIEKSRLKEIPEEDNKTIFKKLHLKTPFYNLIEFKNKKSNYTSIYEYTLTYKTGKTENKIMIKTIEDPKSFISID